MVRESEINAFNLPVYSPYKDEVEDIIKKQGSFSLDVIELFDVPYDTNHATTKVSDQPSRGKKVANIMRASLEPMLVKFFETCPMDILFHKYEKYLDNDLSPAATNFSSIVISLTKI